MYVRMFFRCSVPFDDCVCLQWVTAARLALPVASHFRVQLFFIWQIKYDDDDDDDDDDD